MAYQDHELDELPVTARAGSYFQPHSRWRMLLSRRPSRKQILLALSVTALIGLAILNLIKKELYFLYITRVLPDLAPDCKPFLYDIVDSRTLDERTTDIDTPIPDIVHYVWLLQDRPNLEIDFKTFLSLYSTHLYFTPEKIYIHTDATLEQFNAAKTSAHESTRWALKIPNLEYHYVTAPNHTTLCRNIHKIQHKSDFIRTQILYEHGGIYMDTDIIPLRSIAPLLHSGFANIFGLELPGRTNNGFMMAKPGSVLMSIYRSEMHRVFDNRWSTHSMELLSKIAKRLGAVPNEVLILGEDAFTPSSWEKENVDKLFKPHPEQDGRHYLNPDPASLSSRNDSDGTITPLVSKNFNAVVNYWDVRDEADEWEDYSSSYVIHAFDGNNYWPEQVDLEYVLARRSNYARAVYPAVEHAIKWKIMDREVVLPS